MPRAAQPGKRGVGSVARLVVAVKPHPATLRFKARQYGRRVKSTDLISLNPGSVTLDKLLKFFATAFSSDKYKY